MKILFLNSTSTAPFEIKYALEHSIGGTNTAGVLESMGHEIDLYDLNAMLNDIRREDDDNLFLNKEELESLTYPPHILEIYKGLRPMPSRINYWVYTMIMELPDLDEYDVICISLNRWMYTYYPSVASYALVVYMMQAMKPEIPIFMGGEYAYEMMEAYGCMEDFQREIPIVNIVRGRDIAAFNEILTSNITYPKNIVLGQTRKAQLEFKVDSTNEVTATIKDLFPKEVYDKYEKLHNVEKITLAPFKFSEGCIFKCAFCPSGLDPTFLKNDAIKTVDSLERVYDQGFTDFKFFNDNLNFKIRFLKEFANEIVKRNMKIRFSDSANLRVGDKEMFDAIAEAGCIKLWYGTETISNRILKEVHKEVGENQVYKMMQWAADAGIMNFSNFIFNFPHETDEEFQMLYDFIEEYLANGLMDAYKLSQFRVLLNTEYEKFPENFRITLREMDEADKMWKFDEIGGVTWEERQRIGSERDHKLRTGIISRGNQFILVNDHLIFGLRKAGYGKTETKSILKELTDVMPDDILDKIIPDISSHTHYKKMFTDINAVSRNEGHA
jgi:radical SAM superfamily enzyme YgiQ (UPF0313 family)